MTTLNPPAWFGDPADIIEAATTGTGNLLARIRASRPTWMRGAACRGADPNIFHPRRGQPSAPAKAICSTCPVIDECLAWSLTQPEPGGILGGIGGRARRAARRARGAA